VSDLARSAGVALALVACGASASGNGDEPAPRSIAELRSRLQRELDGANLPGVGIAIVQGGEVAYAGGVGKADLARGTEITGDTRFRVGSITKTVIGLAAVKLRDEGKLDLDARLAELAPEITVDNPWEATHPVRVAQLLEHTAGFDDMHAAELVNPGAADRQLGDVLAVYPASRRPRWPPGTRMAYANPGYTVAGYLIEKVTGRAYEDHVHDAILAPIGMPGASLRLSGDAAASLAHAYDDDGREVPRVPLLHRPAGNLIASPAELAQLVRFFLHRGRVGDVQVLPEASVDRAERNATLPYDGYRALATQYGLGNHGEFVRGFVTHGHDGSIDGFSSIYAYVPDHQVGWVVLFNTTAGHDARQRVIDLVAGFALRGLEAPPLARRDAAIAELADVAGHYRVASPRHEQLRFRAELLEGRTITLEDGVLHQRELPGGRSALVPVGPGLFRRETEPGPSVLFTRADDGTPVMFAGDDYLERASPWPTRLRLVGLAAAALIALGYTVICGTGLVLSARFRSSGRLAARGLPALATLAGGGLLAGLQWPRTMLELGTRTPLNVVTFALSIVYPALVALALAMTMWAVASPQPASRVATWFALLAATANAVLCAHLLSWGFLAFRMWAS